MKKLLSVLTAAICLTVCAFSFASCGDDNQTTEHTTHHWSATYTEDGDRHYQTCDGCNEKKYSIHDYGAGGVCVCGKHKPETPVAATGVSLNKEEITLEIGGTETLTATVAPENATDKTVTWESDKTNIATVDNTGKVTAVKDGTAVITAKTANGKTATCTVTVNKAVVPVTDVALNKTELTLEIGDADTLTATLTPENATDKTVTWTVAPAGVVSVDNTGKVTAIKDGTATITAAANNKKATCTVTVKPITNSELIASLDANCAVNAAKKCFSSSFNFDETKLSNGTWYLTKDNDGNVVSANYTFTYLGTIGLVNVDFEKAISAKDLKDGNIGTPTYKRVYKSEYDTTERDALAKAICDKLFNTKSEEVTARYLKYLGAAESDSKVEGTVAMFQVIEVTDKEIKEAKINIATSADDEAYAGKLNDETKYRVYEEKSATIEGDKLVVEKENDTTNTAVSAFGNNTAN